MFFMVRNYFISKCVRACEIVNGCVRLCGNKLRYFGRLKVSYYDAGDEYLVSSCSKDKQPNKLLPNAPLPTRGASDL